jgi:CDP-diglyceride synthetase
MDDDLGYLWLFLPILGAALAHAPVLRFNLLPRLKQPIDRGRCWRGRRLLGDNKTWRGALVMTTGAALAAILLWQWPWFRARMPEEIRRAGALPYALLLSLGATLAELPNSFLKRQLDIAPGKQRGSFLGAMLSIFDQGDFVFGVWIALLPIWVMSPTQALTAFVAVVLVHAIINVIGYAIGARTSPL